MDKDVFIDIDMLEIGKPFVVRFEGKSICYRGFTVEDVDQINIIKMFNEEDSYFFLAFRLYRGGKKSASFVTDIKEIVQVKDLGSVCFVY